MRHTSALFLLLLTALLLPGCAGSRTRLNPGAELGWYVADSAWMFQHAPPDRRAPCSRLDGYYDPANGDIVMSEQLHGYFLVARSFEELVHAFDHQRPASLWALIRRYQAPGFLPIAHSPEELARLIAVCATLPPVDPASPPSRNPR